MAHVDPESARLPGRLATHLGAKVRVWLGLAVGICVPYFTLQQVHWFPVRQVPATPVDAWVPLTPSLIWAYLSIAVLVPLAPLLAGTREALRRYAWGLFLLCVPCFVCFALFPVEGPRPEVAPDHPLHRWLVSVDRPTNSMPSLHAGLTVYSLLFAWRVTREDLRASRAGGLVSALAAAWGVLILYSTLATKQHWFVDLPAGALLAVAAHAAAWRSEPPATERVARPQRGA